MTSPGPAPNNRPRPRPGPQPAEPTVAAHPRRRLLLIAYGVIAAVAAAVIVFVIASSGGDDPAVSTPVEACKAGQPVGTITGDSPACANVAHSATNSVQSHGCYPEFGHQVGTFYIVTYGVDVALYGKPGGVWHQSKTPDTLDRVTIAAIGC